MNKWPKIVPTLSMKYIKYKVGGWKIYLLMNKNPEIVPTLASLCQHSRMDLDQQVTSFYQKNEIESIFLKESDNIRMDLVSGESKIVIKEQ